MKKLALLVGLACVTAASAQDGKGVAVKKSADAVEFYAGGELVTRYMISPDRPKPIFYPVYAPGKVPLTRAWPIELGKLGETKDHIHQQSAWFCHGDVIPEGVELKHKIRGIEGVDFWSVAPGHGRMVCTRVDEPVVGKDRATIKTHNEWRTADGVKIIDEDRTIHLYDLGPTARLLVCDIDLKAAVPLKFGDTKEGAFGVRINDEITAQKKGKIQNAEGVTAQNLKSEAGNACWGKASAWCDYSGPVDGKQVGLAVLADPKNVHPTHWHVRAYGLMAANPFGRDRARFPPVLGRKDLVTLAKGEHLRLRYGMLLHTGDAETGRVAEAYQRFVQLRDKE